MIEALESFSHSSGVLFGLFEFVKLVKYNAVPVNSFKVDRTRGITDLLAGWNNLAHRRSKVGFGGRRAVSVYVRRLVEVFLQKLVVVLVGEKGNRNDDDICLNYITPR